MKTFRILLVLIFICILGYTIVVAKNHGLGLLPIFFGDIAAMTWPGQFNFDFMCFLILSALWLSWRHHFSLVGITPLLGQKHNRQDTAAVRIRGEELIGGVARIQAQ